MVVDGASFFGEGDTDRQLGEVGQELVQGRVEQPDGHRQAVHRGEDPDEVLALERQQRRQRGLPARVVVGDDQPFDEPSPLAEEHVLGPAQADPGGAETTGPGRVVGGVGVGPHAEAAPFVGVTGQQGDGRDQVVLDRRALEPAHDRGVDDRDRPGEDLAGGSVERDEVALDQGRRAATDGEPASGGVDLEVVCATDAGAPESTGNHRRVRGAPPAAGEHTLGGDQPGQVVGVGLLPDQDEVSPSARPRRRRWPSRRRRWPTAAPGEAFMPRGERHAGGGRGRTGGTSARPAGRR